MHLGFSLKNSKDSFFETPLLACYVEGDFAFLTAWWWWPRWQMLKIVGGGQRISNWKKDVWFSHYKLCVISFFVLVNSFGGGGKEMLMRKSWLFPLLIISIGLLWQVCSLWLKIVEKWWKWKPGTDYNRTILTRPWIFGRM